MERVEVPEDRQLSELIERAERGDEVVIVRNGREVGRVTAPDVPDTIDQSRAGIEEGLKRFAELRTRTKCWRVDGAKLVREMRDLDP